MTLPIILRPEASDELEEAVDWYEQQRPGLGSQLMARVQDTFDRIVANPKLHTVVERDIRRARVRGFPYSVFYHEESTQIVVISVFHSSRDPSVWQGRN